MSVSIFLLWLLSIPLAIHATPEGVLLNCGSSDTLKQGDLTYIPDDNFIKVGNKSVVKEPGVLPVLSTVRYFPNKSAKRYCFSFSVFKGSKILVKSTYYYGGFDGGKEPPVFDQIIDGTKWSMVNTTEDYMQGLSSYYEAVLVASNKVFRFCLARNQYTVSSPFISALELETLDHSLYNSTNFGRYALNTIARHSFGSNGDIIGYPEDTFNRLWHPFTDSNPIVLCHSNVTPTAFWNMPPKEAFKTAITTSRGKTLTIKWPPFSLPHSSYYIALYFQDGRTPSPYSWRSFDIAVNGDKFFSNLNVTTNGVVVYGTNWLLSGQTEISLQPPDDMTVGPIINAGEIFQIFPLGGRTLTRDVMAMENLVSSFDNQPEDWIGDPCLPKEYTWTGVTCSPGKFFRVVSLNLTGFGVSGSLPQSISSLTALSHIWLGDNKLSGTLPDMSQLKSLETLHLENNKFEGNIPSTLDQLPELRELFFENNNFNGTIPKSLTTKTGLNLRVSPGNNLLR